MDWLDDLAVGWRLICRMAVYWRACAESDTSHSAQMLRRIRKIQEQGADFDGLLPYLDDVERHLIQSRPGAMDKEARSEGLLGVVEAEELAWVLGSEDPARWIREEVTIASSALRYSYSRMRSRDEIVARLRALAEEFRAAPADFDEGGERVLGGEAAILWARCQALVWSLNRSLDWDEVSILTDEQLGLSEE